MNPARSEADDEARVHDDERDADGAAGSDAYERGRPKLTRRDTWRLVFATYRVSFPYLLIFIIGMLAATWLVTSVFFR